jgi:hypothetical protein
MEVAITRANAASNVLERTFPRGVPTGTPLDFACLTSLMRQEARYRDALAELHRCRELVTDCHADLYAALLADDPALEPSAR